MRQASGMGRPARQTTTVCGIVFIEKQHSATAALRRKKYDCGQISDLTLGAFSGHWQKLHETLGNLDAAVALALLGEKPDAETFGFKEATLKRQLGALIDKYGGSEGEIRPSYAMKLVIALAYLGELCRFASEGDAEGYVKFLDEKIIDCDGLGIDEKGKADDKPYGGRTAVGNMLLKSKVFYRAVELAKRMVEADAPSLSPQSHAKKIAPPPLAEQPKFRIELPEVLKKERAEKRKQALAACLGMVEIKLAALVLELRQAAIYTLETGENAASGTSNEFDRWLPRPKGDCCGNRSLRRRGVSPFGRNIANCAPLQAAEYRPVGNEEKKSQLTLDAIDGSGLQELLCAADKWKTAGLTPSLENIRKLWKTAMGVAPEANALAEKLHGATNNKLARKIGYLASLMSLLEKNDAEGALFFWGETLPSKIKKRADGVGTGLAAKSLLEDRQLSLSFGKLKETARYS